VSTLLLTSWWLVGAEGRGDDAHRILLASAKSAEDSTGIRRTVSASFR
jgi:hypothetical protein